MMNIYFEGMAYLQQWSIIMEYYCSRNKENIFYALVYCLTNVDGRVGLLDIEF